MLSRLSPFVRCILLRVVESVCAKFETAVKLLASCKRTQQLPTMLEVVGQQFSVRFHGAKSLYFISFLVNTVLLILTPLCLRSPIQPFHLSKNQALSFFTCRPHHVEIHWPI